MSPQTKGLRAQELPKAANFSGLEDQRIAGCSSSCGAKRITSLRPMAQVATPAADSLLTGDQ
ncbi:hypothetical protein C5612_29100 [Pseudomonas frederiksbergensis]|uniref:Uncharacterized protein n=1 Tax=Pseudomonas frederiksbergensis TaxID=104087 RepID=A0A2S8H623_9PSED|nr:hypothetical protein C5612_29100 [Pseudomonas frederiksbergensis]